MYKNKALINYISNYFPMHPSRLILMVEMLLSFIKVGSVQQNKIAQGSKIKTKTSSTIRRIQRFFEQQFLDPLQATKLIFNLFNWEAKIILTLDRTNWKFGKIDINFLVISGIYKNYSIPLCWLLLSHRGNSNTSQRINLIERLLLVIPIDRVKTLLADREFASYDWLLYLCERGIPFCIRIKESMLVYDTRRGGKIKLKKLFRHLLIGQSRELHQKIVGIELRICGTRIPSGEFLILAVFGDNDLFDAYKLYAHRWTIETMFKSFKSAGFNFEDTHQQNLERLYKMMILLTISYAWAIKIGEIKNDIRPIKIKINQRAEFSLFSYGFRTIQTILLKETTAIYQKLLCLITNITTNTVFSPLLARITVVY